ncbi:MAG: hypothetical protein ACTMH4_16780 [Sphingobacterium sp.]
MITVQVTYTVQDEYVPTNKENIALFIRDFGKIKSNAFRYRVYQKSNGNTFVHISEFEDEVIQAKILREPAFVHFQQQRDLNLKSAPAIEFLNHVGNAGTFMGFEEKQNSDS